ncbi:MAG: DUF418 domain-containing protein, partial [Ferruginibacter sp.]
TDTVSSNERIQSLDIIRGFALFGVLVVNMGSSGSPNFVFQGWTGIAEQIISWFVRFFITHKFVSIFSFLFGVGFAIQLFRAEARKAPFIPLYFRRILFLYLFGVANFILTDGDILQEYAMVGVLILLLYKLPKTWYLILAFLYIIAPRVIDTINEGRKETIILQLNSKVTVDSSILDTYVGTYSFPNGSNHIITRKGDSLFGAGRSSRYQLLPQSSQVFLRSDKTGVFTFLKDTNGQFNQIIYELSTGRKVEGVKIVTDNHKIIAQTKTSATARKGPQTYMQLIKTNAKNYWDGWKKWSWSNFLLGLDITFPLFLIGLYVGRSKVFDNNYANEKFLKTAMRWCFAAGLTGTTISTFFDAWNYYNHISSQSYNYLIKSFIELSWMLGLMALGLAYVAKLALILKNNNWKHHLNFFAPVGRMGLTNYILQSFIVTISINSFGLNLGNVHPFWLLILSIIYFILIVVISRLWFRHFLLGPLEWLWRSLTYLKILPIRISQRKS